MNTAYVTTLFLEIGGFFHIAQRTWKTHRVTKYASTTRPKKTLRKTVPKNASKYPKLTCFRDNSIVLR